MLMSYDGRNEYKPGDIMLVLDVQTNDIFEAIFIFYSGNQIFLWLPDRFMPNAGSGGVWYFPNRGRIWSYEHMVVLDVRPIINFKKTCSFTGLVANTVRSISTPEKLGSAEVEKVIYEAVISHRKKMNEPTGLPVTAPHL